MRKIIFTLSLFASGALFAQEPSSQSTSQPSSQATSRPALPPPAVVAPTEPLVGWTPPSFDEPAESQPVEENTALEPPAPPRPISQIANATFASAGIGFIAASSGALLGLISAARPNQPGAAREETALGWQLGGAFGTGLGVVLSARDNARTGSRAGAFVGSAIATTLSVVIAFPATDILEVGVDDAQNTIPFFFVVPYVASVGGAMLGYELFPQKGKLAKISNKALSSFGRK
jgi:hypothetical protein